MRFALLLLALAVIAFPGSAEPVSFSQDVLPILEKECGYCHMRGERYGYLVLDEANAYQALVNVSSFAMPDIRRVKPGDPDNSYLVMKLDGRYLAAGGEGWIMPFFRLRKSEIETITRWIAEGAADN